MEAFIIYASALAIAYYIAKVIFVIVAVSAIFCTVLVCLIVHDVYKMLQERKARRDQR